MSEIFTEEPEKIDSAVDTEPAAEIDTEPAAETEPEIEIESAVETESDAETEPATEPDTEPDAETESATETKPDAEPEPAVETEPETEPEPTAELLTNLTPEKETESSQESALLPGLEKESDPEPDLLPTPEKESDPEPDLLPDPKQEIVQESELIYEREEEDENEEEEQSPYNRPGKWYVVSTASGHEKLAKSNLQNRIQSMNVAEKVFEVSIPMEEQVEFKGAKKEVVKKKVFPGYLLVRCILDEDTWHVIRNTPSITGFIGPGSKPSPLSRTEVETFLGQKSDGLAATKKIRPRLRYEVGETVRVKEGPFTDFQGEVTEINEDQLKVKLLLNIFGRETPVELEFSQVSKQ